MSATNARSVMASPCPLSAIATAPAERLVERVAPVAASDQRALTRRAREHGLDVDPARTIARHHERRPLARRERAFAVAVEREQARSLDHDHLAELDPPHA